MTSVRNLTALPIPSQGAALSVTLVFAISVATSTLEATPTAKSYVASLALDARGRVASVSENERIGTLQRLMPSRFPRSRKTKKNLASWASMGKPTSA